MPFDKTITQTISKYLRWFLLITISTTGFFWLFLDYLNHQQNIHTRKAEFVSEKKALLKQQVERTISYMEYMRDNTQERLRKNIQSRTKEAHALATHLYQKYINTLSSDKIQSIILEALRSIRYHGERGYYFATRLDGMELLCAACTQLEGKNLLSFRDSTGKWVIKDMIQIAKSKKEDFYEYTWTKPHTQGNNHLKISYVKYFSPLNFYIGTGEYLSDVTEDIQKEIISRIEQIKFDKDGYIFAGTYEGISISGPAKGKNMYQVSDPNGVKIVQKLIHAAQTGGGFVEYVLPRFKGLKAAPKLSYSAPFPDWKWYIGSGMYIDELDGLVHQIEKVYFNQLIAHILLVLTILLSTWLISLYLIKRFSDRIGHSIELFENAFQDAALQNTIMNSQDFAYREFYLIAQAANVVLREQAEAKQELEETSHQLHQLLEEQNFILLHMQDFVYRLDKTGQLLFVSPSVKQITGYTASEWKEQTLIYNSFQHPEEKLSSGKSTHPFELEITDKNGQKLILEINESPYLEEGKIAGSVGVARDITNRKITEKQLKLNQVAIAKSTVEIFWLDQDANIIYANEMACHTLGYSIEELYGQPTSLIDPQFKIKFWHNYWKNASHSTLNLQSIHQRKNGSTYPIEVKVTSFEYDTQKYYFAFITDISERIKTQEFLIQNEKMASLGTLAAGTAHEINNPLGIILQAIQNVERRLLAELPKNHEIAAQYNLDLNHLKKYLEERKILFYIDSIKAAGERAAKIISNMLNFSHRNNFIQEDFDLNKLVTNALDLAAHDYDLSKKYDFKHIELIQELHPTPLLLRGNPTELEQVILNLLKNSTQALHNYHPKDHSQKITIKTRKTNTDALLILCDNGPGIPEDIQKHLFDPFFTTKPVGEGTGLGLSLAYFIITEKHKGKIEISSSAGQGTVFSISLPLPL